MSKHHHRYPEWQDSLKTSKPSKIECPLCAAIGKLYNKSNRKHYYSCPNCRGIYVGPGDLPSAEEEKEHYKKHNNDVDDPNYQAFVTPIVDAVKRDYGPEDIGLDYGCGTGPVITKLLRDAGYQVNLYDPFFANYEQNLERQYDYIICCEVAEHFHDPAEEFWRLRLLLKPGGSLYVKTVLYCNDMDFDGWYYKDDPTHVFFYSETTLEWIRRHCGFSELSINEAQSKFEDSIQLTHFQYINQ